MKEERYVFCVGKVGDNGLLLTALTACCSVVEGFRRKMDSQRTDCLVFAEMAGLIVSTAAHGINVQYILRGNVEVAVWKED